MSIDRPITIEKGQFFTRADAGKFSRKDYLEYGQILWEFLGARHRQLKPADVAIVLGSHRLNVPRYAAQIYRDGLVKSFVCTGANSGKTAGWSKTEAETYADILIDEGVPSESVLIEPLARNIGQNLAFSRDLLGEPERVLLIAHHLASMRAYLTALKQWPDLLEQNPEKINCRFQVAYPEENFFDQDVDYKIRLAFTEVDKLNGEYPVKGFTVPINLPSRVRRAYEVLKTEGIEKTVKASL